MTPQTNPQAKNAVFVPPIRMVFVSNEAAEALAEQIKSYATEKLGPAWGRMFEEYGLLINGRCVPSFFASAAQALADLMGDSE
jgi:hypothetical protein